MKKDGFKSYCCVCLSMSHLTTEDARVLAEFANEDQMIFDRDTGFIIKLYGEAEYNHRDGMSASFNKILDWAHVKGFRQIEFDTDVEPVDMFETFQW